MPPGGEPADVTYVLSIIFMVLVFWRPQEWLFPVLYGWPILDIIVIISVLTLAMERDQRELRIPRGPVPWMLAALFLATLASHAAHTYWGGIVETFPETFKPIFFTFMLLTVLDRADRLRTFVIAFVAMCVVMGIHALMQARLGYGFKGVPPLIVVTPERGMYARSQFFGIFGDPNDLAQILATAIPLTFAIPRRMNFLKFAICAAIGYFLYKAILTTESRGGMMALAGIGFTLLVLRFPARWMPVLVGLGLAATLFVCRFKAGALLDQSAQERVVFWGLANQAFKHNPIFGIGYNMFWQVARDRAAHNAFVGCYTELGLFGYWFWFGILLLGLIGCWRARRAVTPPRDGLERYLRRVAGMAIAAVAGFSVAAYFLSRTFIFPYFFLFAFINAVALIAWRIVGNDRLKLIERRAELFRVVTLGTLGSILFIYVSIVLLNIAYYG